MQDVNCPNCGKKLARGEGRWETVCKGCKRLVTVDTTRGLDKIRVSA